MRAYSLDLRERIVAAVAGGLAKAEAARRFGVDVSTVKRYVGRAAAGDLAPRRGPGRPRRIRPGDEAALGAQVAAANDADLAEHCRTWAAERGTRVSRATMGRALARAGLTRKKRRSSPPSAPRGGGPPGGPRPPPSTPAPSSSSTRPTPTSA